MDTAGIPVPVEAVAGPFEVPVAGNLDRLLAAEDTDGDRRITVEDRGPARFDLVDRDGRIHQVAGTYPLANLLSALARARDTGEAFARIDAADLYAPPATTLSREIRAHFWDRLVRRMDAGGIRAVFADPKKRADRPRIYVPHGDAAALACYRDVARQDPALDLDVVRLPERLTPEYIKSIDDRPGLLALAMEAQPDGTVRPLPFVVPGGRFNEMYGWDSHFIAMGLLEDGRVDLARAMVDHFAYQVRHYGRILNANRSYYLSRSQPPFLVPMALAVHARLPAGPEARAWLAGVLAAAVAEYERFWTVAPRLTATGLSRYYDDGLRIPPEVRPASYLDALRPYADARGLTPEALARAYDAGEIAIPELDAYFLHDRAMRESGHDTTYRFVGRAADLVTVDLNALLYRCETDLARAIAEVFGGRLDLPAGDATTPDVWADRARRRKARMDALLWDPDRGMYLDLDLGTGRRVDYVAATALWPLWAGVPDPDRARVAARNALALLEVPGGIVSSTEASRGPLGPGRPPRQWDFPYGWPPHQVLAWEGLARYGMDDDACRLAYRWLYTIALSASRYNNLVAEKYDLVERTFQMRVEYGNVGAAFTFYPDGGFGWTNASYNLGLRLLTPDQRNALDRLVPPEELDRAADRSVVPSPVAP